MGVVEGYAIVRRHRCAPYVLSLSEWNELPRCDGKGRPWKSRPTTDTKD